MSDKTIIQFYGMTTFRIKTHGVTILHDTWLEKPALMKRYLELGDVTECDYIFISHAHFDHLPGADRLALKTGATVIANAEAINCLRRAGVPEEQLILVAGGERIPLFTKDILAKAKAGTIDLALGPVLAPPTPHVKYAALAVHAWPSLHCLLPDADDIPDVFDTGKHYPDNDDGFMSSLAVTKIMQNVVFRMRELVPENELDAPSRSISDYVSDRRRNIMSHYDGGQIIYNFLIGDKVVLLNSHTGAYDGVMRSLQPKPDVAFLAAAGRPNLNGRPWVGSAAEFLTEEVKWLGEPKQVYFCLHDESVCKPFYTDTTAAKERIQKYTRTKVTACENGATYVLFDE